MKAVKRNNVPSNQSKLVSRISSLLQETCEGKTQWEVICSTSEYNGEETKPAVTLEGRQYLVDECFVSYYEKKSGFFMVTYEMMHRGGDDCKSTNLVFCPPLGIRYFDLNTLLPYAVETDQVLLYQIHKLWELMVEQKKNSSPLVDLKAEPRELTIEEE